MRRWITWAALVIIAIAGAFGGLLAIDPRARGVWVTILGVLAALVGVVVGLWSTRDVRAAVTGAEKSISEKSLEERITELSESMRDSARLVEQVSTELEGRAATVRRLKEEAETAEAILGLGKVQTEAVRRMMDAELAKAGRRIRSDSVKIGIAGFVAGGGVTLLVTLLVPPHH